MYVHPCNYGRCHHVRSSSEGTTERLDTLEQETGARLQRARRTCRPLGLFWQSPIASPYHWNEANRLAGSVHRHSWAGASGVVVLQDVAWTFC